jgi:hypothetical protein
MIGSGVLGIVADETVTGSIIGQPSSGRVVGALAEEIVPGRR